MQPKSSLPVVLAIAVLLIVGGVAIGYFAPAGDEPRASSGFSSVGAIVSPGASQPEAVTLSTPASGAPAARTVGLRFALSEYDLTDQILAPQLASDGSGNVWLAWDSQTGDEELSLYFTHSRDGGHHFEPPRVLRTAPIHRWDAIIRGKPAQRESRLWPRLAWSESGLSLAWVEPAAEDHAQLQLLVAQSHDGGENFSDPRQISGTEAVRPTFVGFTASRQGDVAASWLDHRHDAQQPFFGAPESAAGSDQMVYAGPDGEGICPCCNMAVALGESGATYVAFRNNVGGFRDIWLSVRRPGAQEFDAPIALADPRWEFGGCPHDGPSLAVVGEWLHVVWMDAHTGTQQVYHGRARIGEWAFAVQPLATQSGGGQGHPALAAGPGGSLHVVWDESPKSSESQPARVNDSADHAQHGHGSAMGSSRVVCHAVSLDGGLTFSQGRPLAPRGEAFQTRPMAVVSGEGTLCVGWTELSADGKQIVIFSEAADKLSVAARK